MRAHELTESAVDELKNRLPKLKRHNYDTIDHLMQNISVKHKITGKKLHDMFVKKYGHTPDTWIKKIKNKLSEQGVAEAKASTASFRASNKKRAELNSMSDEERKAHDKEQQEKQRKRDDARLERERQKNKGVAEAGPGAKSTILKRGKVLSHRGQTGNLILYRHNGNTRDGNDISLVVKDPYDGRTVKYVYQGNDEQEALELFKKYNTKISEHQDMAEESKGLWANIHAKRERIKNGSGEHMRKPGSKGAPTASALKKSAVEEGDVLPLKRPMNKVQHGKRTFPPTQRDVKEPEGNVTPLNQKKSNVSEGVEGPDDVQKIKDFIKWSHKTLNIQKPYPKITISKNTKVAQAGHHTGVHKGNDIWVYVGNRNLIDIFRTIFHELTHHRQMQLNMIKDGDSYPGSPIEMLADMAAGKFIKIYGKDHPEMFK
jgi:hypothetical protein